MSEDSITCTIRSWANYRAPRHGLRLVEVGPGERARWHVTLGEVTYEFPDGTTLEHAEGVIDEAMSIVTKAARES